MLDTGKGVSLHIYFLTCSSYYCGHIIQYFFLDIMFCSTMSRLFLCPLATVLILHVALSHGSGIESINVQNSPTYISISWVTAAGSSWDYYTVDVIKSSQRSVSGYPTNTTDTTHLITGLRPGEQYTISVTPWTTEGAGDSLNKTVTTEAIAEGEILVSDVTSSSAFIQWRPVAGVFYYSMVAEPSDAIGSTGGIFEAEVGLTILLPGTVFNVTIRGGTPAMDLASTQIRSAPESPVNVSLEQTGMTEANLSWTPPTSPPDAYEFYVMGNSTSDRSHNITTKQRDDVSDNEVTLTDLSPATIYSFKVGSVLNARDSFKLQRSDQNDSPTVYGRTGPEAPLYMNVTDISNVSVTMTLTPPGSRYDGYELFLFNSTTNHTSRIDTGEREDDMTYNWTKSELSPSTNYTVEVWTFLNAEGSFPLQKSENNLMQTFQTGERIFPTGNAFSPTLHYIMFLIPAFLAVFLV